MFNKKENKETWIIEYQRLQARLKMLKTKKSTLLVISVISLICCILFALFLQYQKYILTTERIIYTLSICLFIFLIVILCGFLMFEIKENSIKTRMTEYEVKYIQEDAEEDIFKNSIKMSYKYLDQYYLQTREQAQRGFVVTISVSIFGAILISVGIVAMFIGETSPSYVTCASGVIIEFVATIFFYLYNRTIASMKNYHNKLVLSHNISIALKISDSLPNDNKVEAKNMIIRELLKDINLYFLKTEEEIKIIDRNKSDLLL